MYYNKNNHQIKYYYANRHLIKSSFKKIKMFQVPENFYSKKLSGRIWDERMLNDATSFLLEEMELSPSAPGGMVNYRAALTAR